MDKIVEVKNLVKRYGEITAVAGISFEVYEGEIFGMLGPNGAGKTTTVECIEGLRIPDEGRISVFGLPVGPQSEAIKPRIGVQLQTTALYRRLTVRETLELFASFYPRHRPVDELIEMVGLKGREKALVKELSGGQRQRLSFALALVNDAEILFLDEPTLGLDPQARRNAWDIITAMRKEGKTIFLTTHYMEEAERLCDRVAIIDYGHIIALDSPEALIKGHFKERAVVFEAEEVDEGALQALPGVTHVRCDGPEVTLYTTDAPATLAALVSFEEVLSDLHVRRATLEDVFLKLTGRRLRD
jgi:ABC-2 type transport system ATP-binding protein